MTKSNKTLLCCLLTCVMVLACALTLLPIATPTTANAAETVVTFNLKSNATKEEALGESLPVKGDVDGYSLILKSITKGFRDVNGIRLGSSKQTGSFEFDLPTNVTVTKVSVFAKRYASDTAKITIGNSEFSTTDTEQEYAIEIGSGTSITVVGSAKRSYIGAICLYVTVNETPTHEHDNWSDVTVVSEATCTKDGTGTRTCLEEGCGVVENVVIPALGHSWNDWTILTEATCEGAGEKEHTCTRCDTVEKESIPALGHSYVDGVCERCGAEEPSQKTITPDHFSSYAAATNITEIEGISVSVNDVMKQNGIQFKKNSGYILLKNVSIKSISFTGDVGELAYINVYELTSESDNNGKEIVGANGVYEVNTLNGFVKIAANNNGTPNFDSITLTFAKEVKSNVITINEKIAAGTGTTETNGKLYIKKGSKVVVTYSIETNTGINGLGGTFNYNKNFFAINDRANDIVVSNIFGTTVQLTGTETTAEAIKFLFVGKDGEENFNGNAVGDFISVTYTVIADITAADLAEMAFGLVDVQAVKEGNVALTGAELVVNNLADYNLAVTNETTITVDGKESGATIERTYDGTTFSVGATESDTYKFASNRTDEPTITWTLGGEPATELKNAGTYTLTIEYAATAEYEAATATYTVVVKKVVLEKEMTEIVIKNDRKPLDKGSVSWDRNDFNITVLGLIEGEKIDDVATITFEPTTLTKPETVSMTVTLQLNGNYVYNDNSDTVTYTTEVTAYATPLKFSGLVASGEYYYGQSFDFTQLTVVNEHNEVVEVTIKITVAKNDDGDVELTTDELKKNFVKNAGSYIVMIVATPASADYEELNAMVEYTILPRTLSNIKLVYTTDGEVSWTNATTYYTDNAEQTTALTDEIVLTYTVGGNALTENKFAPQAKGKFTIAVATNSENYIANNVETLNVYSVTFADDKHDTTTQYRFENQLATSITPNAVGGFEFDGWYVTDGETESKYDFTTVVTADVNLTAKWTALTFTVTLVNGTETQKFENVAYEALLSTLGITDASKADDEDNYYTFVGWTLTAEGETIDLATTNVTDNMTLYAKFTSASNKFTLTWTLTYNGNAVENGTLTVKRNTALTDIAGLPTSKNAKVLRIGTWKNGENVFTAMPTANVEITAAYEIALQAGDVNGDGKVNLDDVVLFRKYLVGGYAMDVVADENIYTAIMAADAASKTMFFKYSANMDNDANLDIRDVATIRMNVVATTEGGEEQTQTTQSAARMEVVSEAVQYAVLPTKFNLFA